MRGTHQEYPADVTTAAGAITKEINQSDTDFAVIKEQIAELAAKRSAYNTEYQRRKAAEAED